MFGKLALDAKSICDYAQANGIPLANGNAEAGTQPDFTEGYFSFNGVVSHETFYWAGIPTQPEWRKDDPEYFEFCKTAYKPYDAVVTAILVRAKVIYGDSVQIGSDGDWSDWQAGRDLYEKVFGEVAECPFERSVAQ
jgi:hypothetical protein